MLRSARSTAEKMIKVNHAGENGAVNIYRSQKLVSYVRDRHLIHLLAQNQHHEEEHRQIFCEYLNQKNIRRCFSYHLCGLGGFILGMITGLIGENAIAATTYAVETVVLSHLEDQLQYLSEADDDDAFQRVKNIIQDEKQHQEAAEEKLQNSKLITRLLIRIVSLSTEGVIRFGMR